MAGEELEAIGGDGTASRKLRWVGLLAPLYLACAVPALMASTLPVATLGASVLLATLLVALSAIDMVEFRLPDVLTLATAGLGVGLTWLLAWDDILARAAAVTAGFAVFWLVAALFRKMRGYDGLGLGDAKLLGAAGAWVGLEGLPSLVLLASLLAIGAIAVALALGKEVGRQSWIPFGPFLGLACWIVWLYGALLP